MAKQTAAAQKRAEAEARKKGKLEASSAAASKDSAKEVEVSGMSLAQAGPSIAAKSADGPKAEEFCGADISQENDVATAGSNKPQTKSAAVAASSGLHDENQASNAAIPGSRGLTLAGAQCEGGQGGSGKPRAGRKRVAEVHEAGEGTRAGQSRSIRSKIGTMS